MTQSAELSSDTRNHPEVNSGILPDIPYRLLLSTDMVGRLIGKAGSSIKQVRSLSGANVIVQDKSTPPALVARQERIVIIRGDNSAKNLALRLLLHKTKDCSPEELILERESWVEQSANGSLPNLDDSSLCSLDFILPAGCLDEDPGTAEKLAQLLAGSGAQVNFGRDPIAGLPTQTRASFYGPIQAVRVAVLGLHAILIDLVQKGVLTLDSFEVSSNPPVLTSSVPPQSTSKAPPKLVRGNTQASRFFRDTEASGFCVRILVSKDQAAWVVGKKGGKISKLREDNVDVNVDEAESPPFDASDRVVSISGPISAKHRVFLQVLTDIEKHPAELSSSVRLLIPADYFGIVMGKKGEQMKKITIATGADIQKMELLAEPEAVPPSASSPNKDPLRRMRTTFGLGSAQGGEVAPQFRLLCIKGSDQQKLSAALMIVQVLDQRLAHDSATLEKEPLQAPLRQESVEGANPPPLAPVAEVNGVQLSKTEAKLMHLTTTSAGFPRAPSKNISMQIVLPTIAHLALLMGPSGDGQKLNAIGKRAGCEIQLGSNSDVLGNAYPLLQLSGTPVANAFAFLLLQESLAVMEGEAAK